MAFFSFSLLSPQDLVSFLHGDPQVKCSRIRPQIDAGVLRFKSLELTGSISKIFYA